MKKLISIYQNQILPTLTNVELPENPTINITDGEFVVGTPAVASTIVKEGDCWSFPAGGGQSESGSRYTNRLEYKSQYMSTANFAFSANIKVNSDETQTSSYGLWYSGVTLTSNCLIKRNSDNFDIWSGVINGHNYWAQSLEYDKWYTISAIGNYDEKTLRCIVSDGDADVATEAANNDDSTGGESFYIGYAKSMSGSGMRTYFFDSTNMSLQNFIYYNLLETSTWTGDEFNNLHQWNKSRLKQ